jgi:hypothetical protein
VLRSPLLDVVEYDHSIVPIESGHMKKQIKSSRGQTWKAGRIVGAVAGAAVLLAAVGIGTGGAGAATPKTTKPSAVVFTPAIGLDDSPGTNPQPAYAAGWGG